VGFRLALAGEGAFGVATGSFTNGLLGARLDWRVSPAVSLGGYLGYANLRGKDGRAHAILPYAQIEHRAPLRVDGSLHWPLRLGSGYLPRNGPVTRVSTGLAVSVGRGIDVVVEGIAMAWLAKNQMLLSLNGAVGLEIGL
jgi:hypothetical protein